MPRCGGELKGMWWQAGEGTLDSGRGGDRMSGRNQERRRSWIQRRVNDMTAGEIKMGSVRNGVNKKRLGGLKKKEDQDDLNNCQER